VSKRTHTEAEMVGAIKQLEAGRTAAEIGRELGLSKHTIMPGRRSTAGWT